MNGVGQGGVVLTGTISLYEAMVMSGNSNHRYGYQWYQHDWELLTSRHILLCNRVVSYV